MPTENPYTSIISEQSGSLAANIKLSLDNARTKNADNHAKVIQLSDKTNLPVDTVERNKDKVQHQVSSMETDYDAIINNYPKLASKLQDSNFATLVHDDIDNVGFWETIGDYGQAVTGGAVENVGMGLSGLSKFNDAFGRKVTGAIGDLGLTGVKEFLGAPMNEYLPDTAAEALSLSKGIKIIGESIKDGAHFILPERDTFGLQVAKGVGQVTSQILVTALTGGAASTSMLVGLGADIGEERAREFGASQDDIDTATLEFSAITGITEKIGLMNYLDRLPPKVKNDVLRFFSDVAISGGIEAAQEAVEGVFHNISALRFDPEGEVLEGVTEEAKVAGSVGVITKALINLVMPGRLRSPDLNGNKELLDEINSNATNSELKRRSPEEYKKHVAEVLQSSGLEEVSIPSEQLVELFQTNPELESAFIEAVPNLKEQLSESSLTGGDVRIKTESYAFYLASDYGELLAEDIRFGDDMTMRESQLYDEEVSAQLVSDYEQFESEMTDKQDGVDSFNAVFDDIKQQILDAGESEVEAQAKAKLFASRYASRAVRINEGREVDNQVDAFQLYTGRKLRIRSEENDEFNNTLDLLRAGDKSEQVELLKKVIDESGLDIQTMSNREVKDFLEGELEGTTFNQAAFHGSPHKFDKFSMEHIGTGEGAQAYGHGLYFAENPKVAGEYLKSVPHAQVRSDFLNVLPEDAEFEDVMELIGKNVFTDKQESVLKALDADDWLGFDYPSQAISASYQNLDGYDPSPALRDAIDGVSHMYEVDVPDEHVKNFLDWDSPLSEQPEKVRKILEEKQKEWGESFGHGSDTYNQIGFNLRTQRLDDSKLEISKYLNSIGIKGIKYFDGGSRSAGEGTRNLVVFDDSIIEVKKVNGEPVDYLRKKSIEGLLGKSDGVELFQSEQKPVELKDEGDIHLVETGKSVTFNFTHNTESATSIFGLPKEGDTFGRDFEPAARFVNVASKERADGSSGNWIGGVLTFRNPLVIPADGIKWKQALSDKYDDKTGKALSKALIADGYDGVITIEENHISETIDLTSFDEAKALFQDGKNDPQGRIQITDSAAVIDLFKSSNKSTLLHEAGHLFIQELIEDAAVDGMPQQVKDDLKALMDFVDAETVDDLDVKLNGESAVDKQEKLARAFEAYLREGKAPSIELRNAFRSFKAWLVRIYETLRGLNIKINDDVRGVFDRILATDEQIKASETTNKYQPIFNTAEDMGVSEERFKKFNEATESATKRAEEILLSKMMRQVAREKKSWWREEKSKVRKQVTEEVNQDPAIRAKHFLQTGEILDSDLEIDPIKLDRSALIEMYGEQGLWKKLPFGKHSAWSKEGGAHPSVIAEQFGFSSGDALVRAMIDSGSRKKVIETKTQQRMLGEHGDILNDGTIEEEALSAIHSSARGEAMMAELKALAKRNKSQVTPASVIKQVAKDIIREKAIRDIRPNDYLRAERSASDAVIDAVQNGDTQAAMRAQSRRLMNHYLYMEARNSRDNALKIQKRMSKFDRPKVQQRLGKAGGEYLEQILGLLDLVTFKSSISMRKASQANTYANWVREQEDLGEPVVPNERLMALGDRTHWRNLTYDELVEFDDTIKNIEHLANVKGKLIVGKDKRDLLEVATGVAETIADNLEIKPPEFNSQTKGQRRKRGVSQFLGLALKAQTHIENMDGGKKIGVVYDALKKYIDASELKRFKRLEKESEAFFEIVSRHYSNGVKLGEKEIFNTFEKLSSKKSGVFIPAIGLSLTKEERLMVALNMGNEKNRQRFKDGRNFSNEQIQAILDTLDKNDLDFVQAVFDFHESFWGEIAQLEKRRTGISPEKVEHTPIVTKAGTIAGGYIPIKFDPSTDVKAQELGNDQMFDEMRSGRNIRAQTRRSHTKARVEGDVNMRVRVDFGVLQEHLNEVVTDVTMGESIDATYRVLHHPDVSKAIEQHLGADTYQSLVIWLEDVAVGGVRAGDGFSNMLKGLRASVTIGAMGLKVATSLIQVSGFTQSFVEVGYKPMFKAMIKYTSALGSKKNRQAINEIYEQSEFMQERSTTFQRDIRDALIRLEGDGLLNNIQKTYFWPIIKMQQMVDIPTWMAGYEVGIKEAVSRGKKGEDMEAFAVNFADQAVENSQGTGLFKGLSSFERGTTNKNARTLEHIKLWTTFYSYFNTKLNLAYRQTKSTDFKSPKEVTALATDYIMLFWIEALIGEYMLGRMPDMEDEDDPEMAMLWYNLKLIMSSIMGTLPLLRETNSVLQGFGSAPGGTRGIETLGRGIKTLGKLATEDEVDGYKVAQSLVAAGNVLSPIKYPAGQINVVLEAMRRESEGEDVAPQDFLIRKRNY